MAGLPGAPPDGISGGSGERAADPPVGAKAIEAAAELALRLRAAANDCLARYEPLALVAAPVPALLVARTVHAAASAVADRCLVAICIAAVKWLLGVSGYNAMEKKKVFTHQSVASRCIQECGPNGSRSSSSNDSCFAWQQRKIIWWTNLRQHDIWWNGKHIISSQKTTPDYMQSNKGIIKPEIGWLFRIFIFGTFVLPLAAPLFLGTFANRVAIRNLRRSEPDVIVVEYEEKNILSHPAPVSGG